MERIIHSLGIDWKLLLAQIINFFILFFILYKFLSKPLLKIIEERKLKIEEGLKLRDEAQDLITKVKNERLEILRKANEEKMRIINEAYKEKERKIEEVKKEIENWHRDELEKLEKEKIIKQTEFITNLYKSAPQLLAQLAFKVFHDEKLNEKFIKNILRVNETGDSSSQINT
jgi:F-type H+-transporting ATPase subunit b